MTDTETEAGTEAVTEAVTEVLLVTEADWIVEVITDALEDSKLRVTTISDGREVLKRVSQRGGGSGRTPDLVIVDFQVGSMGGMAICKDLRLESGANRLEHVPILLLLDRSADEYLAKHSGADAWITKPLNALQIRRSVTTALEADTVGAPAGSGAAW